MAAERTLSPADQIGTILTTELTRLIRARKTLVLLTVQFLPVVFALVYVVFGDVDGLSMFTQTVERVVFPFLVPLAAIFYGGPALVDEMEGRTLTYLTLRPIPKPALFIGKWLAGAIVAVTLVVVPVLALLGVVAAAAGGAPGASASSLLQTFAAIVTGTAAYSAIFAALGAMMAKSLLFGIIYFVVFEMIFAALPVLELSSIRFHMRTAAEFGSSDRLGVLERLVLDEPIALEWWMGLGMLAVACTAAVIVGAYIFTNKQYDV